MAIVQQSLFSWQALDELGDLERLKLLLDNLDDEYLMATLEHRRGAGRDDYPVRAMWNALLAGVVYQHLTVASLRRELLRNGDLVRCCGFDPVRGLAAIPPEYVFSRFLKVLMGEVTHIEKLFSNLVRAMTQEVPDFGRHLGIDSKAINSAAYRPPKRKNRDGRRDTDARYGAKRNEVKREDGSTRTVEVIWFGYKLHLVVDVTYELPVAYEVTNAKVSDTTRLIPMVEHIAGTQAEVMLRAETMTADRGYDSTENNRDLWDVYCIKPIIGIRDAWQEKDMPDTRLLNPKRGDNVAYNYAGNVYCFDPETGERREMAHDGFDAQRSCLKYRCPHAVYGLTCNGREDCGRGGYGKYGRVVRIPLAKDRRVFTPLARSSYAFAREYRKRGAVERVNSRFDVSFGFENHTIRGLQKMKLRCGLALLVMMAMALGHIRQQRRDLARSLVALPAAA